MPGIGFSARDSLSEQDPVSVPGQVIGSLRRGALGNKERRILGPAKRFRKREAV